MKRARAPHAKSALFAVILAGGRGTRFWPRSRRARPKQFLSLAGGRSLLQATVDRIEPLVSLERVLVVTTRDLAGAVREDLPDLPPDNILLEPIGRNTAPAIGLAAHKALSRADKPILIAMPSDHHVRDELAFRQVVSESIDFVSRNENALVTFGVRPTRPETGYGYIETEAKGQEARLKKMVRKPVAVKAGKRAEKPIPIRRFIEKPDMARAKELWKSKGVFWNSGVFVWSARTYLDELAHHTPSVGKGLDRYCALDSNGARQRQALQIYEDIPSISADYAVLEHSKHVYIMPLDVGWNDMGSWIALAEVWHKDKHGNVVEGNHVSLEESTSQSILLAPPGKLIATIGIRDLIAVDTGDVLFLCDARRAQDVRELVALLERMGLVLHI